MALVPCPHCEEYVSSRARSCPKCGNVLTNFRLKRPPAPLTFNALVATYRALMRDHAKTLAGKYILYCLASVALIGGYILLVLMAEPRQDFGIFVALFFGSLLFSILMLATPTALFQYIRQLQLREDHLEDFTSGDLSKLTTRSMRAFLIIVPLCLLSSFGSLLAVLPGVLVLLSFWAAPYLSAQEGFPFWRSFSGALTLFKNHAGPMSLSFVVAAFVILPLFSFIGYFILGFTSALHPALGYTVGALGVMCFEFLGGFVLWTWVGSSLTSFVHPDSVHYPGQTKDADPLAKAEAHAPSSALASPPQHHKPAQASATTSRLDVPRASSEQPSPNSQPSEIRPPDEERPTTGSSARFQSATERLRSIQQVYEAGLISEEELKTKRQEIIDAI